MEIIKKQFDLLMRLPTGASLFGAEIVQLGVYYHQLGGRENLHILQDLHISVRLANTKVF